ncbi:DUF1540 domain-containing protein [Gephyromycinifex aptenodytis]|uniref:DUF1540 domain-containing protein n=1 Tax=Gephyromycinifex aptenodytis TaxID=2716227 RepID=UPI0014458E9A|nr:DUF1540 domain-containing protein [Gephyromycinifex aptenodytis]
MSALATISSCATTACAYNDGACKAGAITVGGSEGSASCGTFVTLDVRGGTNSGSAQVGACQRLECAHNTDLMCTAEAITVSADTALCEMYSAR